MAGKKKIEPGENLNNRVKIVLDDKKINVLLMGVSGAGKSTLINAFLSDNEPKAPTGTGRAVTTEMAVYGEKSKLDFRLIDTPGFEYSQKGQNEIAKQLKKWSKDSIKELDPRKVIHIIWFCIDGQVKRSPNEVLDYLHKVSSFWKDVPIIVVFTKSFFKSDIDENTRMIQDGIREYKNKDELNVRDIISVVAEKKDDCDIFGIEELEQRTSDLITDARAIAEKNIKEKTIAGKRLRAHGIVAATAATAGATDFVSTKDGVAVTLQIEQKKMLEKIAETFEVDNKSAVSGIVESILGTSIISTVAKKIAGLVSKSTDPKVKILAKMATAGIAFGVTTIVGEIGIFAFERVYKGNLDIENTNWDKYVKEILDDKNLGNKVKDFMDAVNNKDGDALLEALKNFKPKVYK